MPARLFNREQRERSRHWADDDQALHFGRDAARRPGLVSRHRRPRRSGDRRRRVGAVGRGAGAISPFSRRARRPRLRRRARATAPRALCHRRPRARPMAVRQDRGGETASDRERRRPRLLQPVPHSRHGRVRGHLGRGDRRRRRMRRPEGGHRSHRGAVLRAGGNRADLDSWTGRRDATASSISGR